MRTGRGLVAAVLAMAVVLTAAGCDLRLASQGEYVCSPDEPTSCPGGWYCQIRSAFPGEHRCYERPGAYCGDGVRNDGEVCDAQEAFAEDSCTSAGFKKGRLRCSEKCDAIDREV
jgi:hypothetical protein